jgi:hypothetical protein
MMRLRLAGAFSLIAIAAGLAGAGGQAGAAASDPVRYDWAGSITYDAHGSVHDEEVGYNNIHDAAISQTGTWTLPGTFRSGGSAARPFDVMNGQVGWSLATWTDATESIHTEDVLESCRTVSDYAYPTFTPGTFLLYAGITDYEGNGPSRLVFGTTNDVQPELHGGGGSTSNCGDTTNTDTSHSPVGWVCGMTYADGGFGFEIPRSIQGTDNQGRPTVRGSVTVPCDVDQSPPDPPQWSHGATGTTTLTFDVVGIAEGSGGRACSNGRDDDGDGRTDFPSDKQCASAADDSERNRPPVARADRWKVLAGRTLDDNVLLNDDDPDGDDVRAKVLKISFAAREYSGVERGGDFLYTAGPGTTRTLRKVITYVAVDSLGARSKPATAVITLKVPPRSAAAPRAGAVAAAATPVWTRYLHWGQQCFSSGLKTKCYVMESLANTAEFNRSTSWVPGLVEAARLCTKYVIVPLKNADCAKKLYSAGINGLWDRGSISSAADQGACLLYRVSRHRTFRHPRAGEWGKPEYHVIDSTVRPFDRANPRTTGWGEWKKDGATIDRWKLPLFCDTNGTVLAGSNVSLETAG